jgi:hypothetical protein
MWHLVSCKCPKHLRWFLFEIIFVKKHLGKCRAICECVNMFVRLCSSSECATFCLFFPNTIYSVAFERTFSLLMIFLDGFCLAKFHLHNIEQNKLTHHMIFFLSH